MTAALMVPEPNTPPRVYTKLCFLTTAHTFTAQLLPCVSLSCTIVSCALI